MLRRTVVGLVAGSLLLAACGGDGGDGDDRAAYVDAMATWMAANEQLPVAAEARECLAGEFVDALGGAPALEEAGVTPAELAGEDVVTADLGLGEEEATAMAASFGNCDVAVVDMLLPGEDVPADVRTCVEENLDEKTLAALFMQSLVDEAGEQPPEALLEPVMACF